MKILVCGKGGSGKSTVATLIARGFKDRGCRVLLVDADESNIGIDRLMGLETPVSLIDSLGSRKGLQKKMMAAFPKGKPLVLFDKRWGIEDIPERCVAETDGIKLMVIGKIHHFGEGCACPMGATSKMFLSNLSTGDNDAVVIDAEAGVEHFGRGVEAGCDMILDVVDPTYESFLLAQKMEEMAKSAGAEILFVLNKVDGHVKEAMTKHINKEKIIAKIPQKQAIFMDSLEGRPLTIRLPEIDEICRFLEEVGRG